MTEPLSRETFVRATRDLPELRISEVVLQTARWQEMKDWYGAFLGVEPGVHPVWWTPSSEEGKGVTMPRTRRPYSAEFRRRLVELVRRGQTPEDLARKFEPSANAIRNWVVQVARDEGRRAAYRRREFIALVVAGLMSHPRVTVAQQHRIRVIGFSGGEKGHRYDSDRHGCG